MSEDARRILESFNDDYEELGLRRGTVNDQVLVLMTRASQMSSLGMIVPETDPDRIAENLNLVDPASLR